MSNLYNHFKGNKKVYVPLITFVVIISVFFFILTIERNQTIELKQMNLEDQLYLVETRIEGVVNQRIRNIMGISAYAKVNPNMTSEEYETFASKLIEANDPVIRNVTIIKGTVIKFVYPYEANKSAIGVDLGEVEAQRDALLYVRDSGYILMTPPVNLVQGGQGLIVRIPIYLTDPFGDYWGQIGLVIDFEEMIEQTGINDLLDDYHIIIDQHDQNGVYQHQIITSEFEPSVTTTEIDVTLPHAIWRITADYKTPLQLSSFFYFVTIIGIGISLIIPYGIHNIYNTNENLNDLVEERTKKLFETNEYLEQSMGELEEQQAQMIILNNQLQDSLDTLEETQQQLILNEKLASLGELVASVAHEINTPLGICVTLTTYLQENINTLKQQIDSDSLTKNELVSLNEDNFEAIKVVIQNLLRASDLVSSFKMVAVDQHLDDYRLINLKEYVTDVSKSLSPKIKKTTHQLILDFPDDIELYTYPGALSQVVTNLVMNSLLHGFKSIENGIMTFKCYTAENDTFIIIEYTDTGSGISEENIGKVFNPFFTTGKGSGSTGLGLHIIHNLIIQMLKGRISLESALGKGVKFTIAIPYTKEFDENHTTQS